MWFWWFILICDCIIPAIMIIAGRMMWKHCPKKINGVVGYRTKMSMINMDTWRFAHDHAGKLWWKVGTTCPNCGAPITNLGAAYCEYCGSAVTLLNLKVWTLHSFDETDYHHS